MLATLSRNVYNVLFVRFAQNSNHGAKHACLVLELPLTDGVLKSSKITIVNDKLSLGLFWVVVYPLHCNHSNSKYIHSLRSRIGELNVKNILFSIIYQALSLLIYSQVFTQQA